MAKLNEQSFRKAISSDIIGSLYLIYGEEKYLVKKYTDMLIKKAVGKDPSDFDITELDSDATLDMIFSEVESIPVFAERKCIVVKDYDFDLFTSSDFKEIEVFVSDISEYSVLIFCMPTLKTNDKKKSSGFQAFVKLAEKYGTVVELETLGDIALEKQVISWAEKNGSKLTSVNASKIISAIGNDMNALKNETDKLSAFANGQEITSQIIDDLCPKNTETRIYSLASSIVKNDFNGTYRQLELLFDKNEKPEIILSVLSSAFVDMYRVRAAAEAGKNNEQIAIDFKYGKRDFVLKNARNSVSKYSTETLRDILEIILEADIKLKSTAADPRIILETMIARMLVTVREGIAV